MMCVWSTRGGFPCLNTSLLGISRPGTAVGLLPDSSLRITCLLLLLCVVIITLESCVLLRTLLLGALIYTLGCVACGVLNFTLFNVFSCVYLYL